MKKLISLVLAVLLCTGAALSLAGCSKGGDTVYAVEAGSAGEAAAKAKGWKTNVVASQADALMEVKSGTSDGAIIDLLMAVAMTGEGTSYPDLKYTDSLTSEEYGVGCRKGSDLADYINAVFSVTYENGAMLEVARAYNLEAAMIEQPAGLVPEVPAGGDTEAIQQKGTLIVGITDFEPMDYQDADGNWIGFDADMARQVGAMLDVDVQFVEIDWDNKIMELNSGSIDVVWNGMTITDEVKGAMTCSNPYFNNAQVVVVKK